MKDFFLIFTFSIFFSVSNGQKKLFGKYKFYTETDERGSVNLNCNNTFVMNDTMIIAKDSSITSIVTGTWKIQNSKILALFVGSITSDSKPVGKLNKLEYDIRDGRLYLKLQNEKQYEKQHKKFKRKYPTYAPGIWEDYKTYISKQNNRYFFIVDIFNCQ